MRKMRGKRGEMRENEGKLRRIGGSSRSTNSHMTKPRSNFCVLDGV
jgi:hypothetical protein